MRFSRCVSRKSRSRFGPSEIQRIKRNLKGEFYEGRPLTPRAFAAAITGQFLVVKHRLVGARACLFEVHARTKKGRVERGESYCFAVQAGLNNSGNMAGTVEIKRPLTRDELAERWDQIVKQYEHVDLGGWVVETNAYGEIEMSPLPEGVHQERALVICELLSLHFPDHKALHERPVLTVLGTKNADVVLIGPEQLEQARGTKALSPAPRICVEILSPSNTIGEIEQKRDAYLRAGAEEVWVCDRNNRMSFFNQRGFLERSKLCPEFQVVLDLSQRPSNKLQEQLLAAYNQLVKTPEDRARLEKENPDLVAERDRIITAQKRALAAQQQTVGRSLKL